MFSSVIGGLILSSTITSATSSSVHGKNNNIAVTPAMGWNSWNHFGCDITEDLIKDTTDQIINLELNKLGYQYVNLDDCWQASTRTEDGKLQPDTVRFPSGMKALGDYIHSKGLKFGIYSSAGFKTCQAFPASLGMETVDANTYAEWGVDYLKYDNCYTDYGPPLKRYPPMAKALESSGRDILYSLCEWGRSNPSAWAGEIAHSWRVTLDIRDDWRSILTRAAIDTPLWRYAGPGGWNDPDMLEVGNGKCTYEEYKTHFSMWAMLKAPLIIGNDVRLMTKDDEAYEILSNHDVIAVNQDPLGWQSRRIWSDRSPKSDSDIWSRGTGVIATYCASTENSSRQQDNPLDQKWLYQVDGTIKNIGTNKCLSENIWNPELESESDFNATDENEIPLTSIDLHFGRGSVKVVDCANATQWDIEAHAGGHIVSRSSKSCIGVDDNPLEIMTNGRRISMSQCSVLPVDFHRMVDVSEHQSWTRPEGSEGIFLNLYQRQCLTVDHDAPVGFQHEIWKTTLSTGEIVIMMLNKGREAAELTVTFEQMGLDKFTSINAYDLWKHADIPLKPMSNKITLPVESHGVTMFKVTVLKA